MEAVAVGQGLVGGNNVSLLLHKTLEKVKVAAQVNHSRNWFRSLFRQLSRLKESTEYLENLKDEAGGIVIRQWLQDLQEELIGIVIYAEKWSRSSKKKWQRFRPGLRGDNFTGWYTRVSLRLQSLEKKLQPALLASCLERLTSDVRCLATTGERDGVGTRENALAQIQHTAIPERIADIQTLLTQGSSRTLKPASKLPRSAVPATNFHVQDSFPDEVFGGSDTLEKVMAEIFQSTCQKCVGLWGTRGAGKTFTAGRVFYDPRVQSYFDGPRNRIWVTASKQNKHAVMKDIFEKLGGYGDDFPAGDDIYGMRSTLKRQLNMHKLFLVMDDVSAANQLDFMDLVIEPEESERRVVILVTTQNEKILDKKHARKVESSLLSEDGSWEMFCRYAFGQTEEVSYELKDVARAVAAECKGLPLALIAVSSGLAGESDLPVWESVLKRLRDDSGLSAEYEKMLADGNY